MGRWFWVDFCNRNCVRFRHHMPHWVENEIWQALIYLAINRSFEVKIIIADASYDYFPFKNDVSVVKEATWFSYEKNWCCCLEMRNVTLCLWQEKIVSLLMGKKCLILFAVLKCTKVLLHIQFVSKSLTRLKSKSFRL